MPILLIKQENSTHKLNDMDVLYYKDKMYHMTKYNDEVPRVSNQSCDEKYEIKITDNVKGISPYTTPSPTL